MWTNREEEVVDDEDQGGRRIEVKECGIIREGVWGYKEIEKNGSVG